ncbi:MAG TPA: uracil phosphoribosyltransferase, partial [Nitrolancea sp.]|nr:uracil phosphoribosyltransferase [Nitrolancea sp.]
MDDFAQPTPMSGRAQPSREAIAEEDRLRVLAHPLAANLVTILRDISTQSREFAWAVEELTRFLLWSALEGEEVE